MEFLLPQWQSHDAENAKCLHCSRRIGVHVFSKHEKKVTGAKKLANRSPHHLHVGQNTRSLDVMRGDLLDCRKCEENCNLTRADWPKICRGLISPNQAGGIFKTMEYCLLAAFKIVRYTFTSIVADGASNQDMAIPRLGNVNAEVRVLS